MAIQSTYPKNRSPLLSSCLGNLLEHYDTALFGLLSPFLAPLIFPSHDPITALLLTYAMIPLGIVAKPIGALLFGYIGDRHGKGYALFITLIGMSLTSFIIAVSPLYTQIGILTPLIFCLSRILQNIFSAGENMGAAIFLLENTPKDRHALFSGFYGASTVAGSLLASAFVFLISYWEIVDIGWRILYLFGCITGVFGCKIRGSLYAFDTKNPFQPFQSFSDFLQAFWNYRKPLLYIIVSSGFYYASYVIALVLVNGFIPLISPFTKAEIVGLNTALLVVDFCTLPFFGWIASRFSKEVVMLTSTLLAAVFALPLFILLENASLFVIIAVRTCLVLIGVAFSAPFHAWVQELIPPRHRYSLISFGYAVGSQALGSPTAALSLFLFKQTGWVASAALYWGLLAITTSTVMLLQIKERSTAKQFEGPQI